MTQNKSKKDELIIRGIINLFQKGAKEEALIESERLIEKGCKFPFLFNLNGIINIELNNWDRAKISLNKAINLDQKYVEAYSNLGIVKFIFCYKIIKH